MEAKERRAWKALETKDTLREGAPEGKAKRSELAHTCHRCGGYISQAQIYRGRSLRLAEIELTKLLGDLEKEKVVLDNGITRLELIRMFADYMSYLEVQELCNIQEAKFRGRMNPK